MKRQLCSLFITFLLLFSIVSVFVHVLPVSATVYVNEDFESWNDNSWSFDNTGTYTNTVEAGSAIFDSYGLNTTITGNSKAMIYKTHTSSNSTVASGWFSFNTLNLVSAFSMVLYEEQDVSSNNQIRFGVYENATQKYFKVYGNGFTDAYYGTLEPTVGVLYNFTVIANRGVGVTHALLINGTEVLNMSVSDNTNYGEFLKSKFGVIHNGVSDNSLKFDNIVVSNTLSDFETTPVITINAPTNTTYQTTTVPVSLSSSAGIFGTIDKTWYNLKNGSNWVYGTNQTYTTVTSMTNIVNGTEYEFYAYANNTEGDEGYSSVWFTVSAQSPSTYTPTYYPEMLLQKVDNEMQMPNGTVVQLIGFNKPELADDPDGTWMGNTLATNSNIREEFAKMKVWSDRINCVRFHLSAYDMLLGTTEAHSAIDQMTMLKYLCEIGEEYGFWIVGDLYRTGDYYNNNDTIAIDFPYPPYTNNTDVIANEQEWVDLSAFVASEMKDYGNFIYEPWNEPNGNDTELDHFIDWFQNVTNAMRYNNFTQPIIVQRGISSYTNVPPQGTTGEDYVEWILTTDLSDPNDNLLLSDHNYYMHIICGAGADGILNYRGWNDTHVEGYFTYLTHLTVSETEPLFWGEFGMNNNFAYGSDDQIKEAERQRNFLEYYNQYNMSYTIYQWRSIGTYPILYSNFTARWGGLLYIQELNDEPFCWTVGTDTDDIYSDDITHSSTFTDNVLNITYSSTPSTTRVFWNVSNTDYPLNATLQCSNNNGTILNATDYYDSLTNLISLPTVDGSYWLIGYDLPASETYYYLTLQASTGGSYNMTEGEYVYLNGTDVVISATADTGYTWVNWSDGSTSNPITVTMTENKTVYANFYDLTAPTYSGNTYNTTYVSNVCLFSLTVSDTLALNASGQWQFGTNNTGAWVWSSATNFTTTPETITATKTLNGTTGIVVQYMWNFTDNAGNSNSTGVLSLTTTYEPAGASSTGFTNPLFQYIIDGDYLYFVVACYTTVLGQAFFGILAFFVSAVVYIKTKSLYLVGFLYLLVGPTYLALLWEFSWLAVIFTVIGIASVFVEFITAWRNR